jgi:hypothetical protein
LTKSRGIFRCRASAWRVKRARAPELSRYSTRDKSTESFAGIICARRVWSASCIAEILSRARRPDRANRTSRPCWPSTLTSYVLGPGCAFFMPILCSPPDPDVVWIGSPYLLKLMLRNSFSGTCHFLSDSSGNIITAAPLTWSFCRRGAISTNILFPSRYSMVWVIFFCS